MTKYRIYASLHEESNEGWIWLPEGIDRIETRDFIIIKRKGYKSAIRCQARTIDKRFSNFYKKRLNEYGDNNEVNLLNEHNPSPIVMNEYFRKILNLTPGEECEDLKISKANHSHQKILTFLIHPNDVVKIATYLALISITLGLLSIIPSYFFSIINIFYLLIIIAILTIVYVRVSN